MPEEKTLKTVQEAYNALLEKYGKYVEYVSRRMEAWDLKIADAESALTFAIDEFRVQESLLAISRKDKDTKAYRKSIIKNLRAFVKDLRALKIKPAPPPWEKHHNFDVRRAEFTFKRLCENKDGSKERYKILEILRNPGRFQYEGTYVDAPTEDELPRFYISVGAANSRSLVGAKEVVETINGQRLALSYDEIHTDLFRVQSIDNLDLLQEPYKSDVLQPLLDDEHKFSVTIRVPLLTIHKQGYEKATKGIVFDAELVNKIAATLISSRVVGYIPGYGETTMSGEIVVECIFSVQF